MAWPPLLPGRPPASATARASEAPDSARGRAVARWQPSAVERQQNPEPRPGGELPGCRAPPP
eukprot:10438719-Alexandrium_andersonii.AAC.1